MSNQMTHAVRTILIAVLESDDGRLIRDKN